ncbi:Rz1 family lipoprotein, partial [Pseudoalteromonas sp. NZS37]
MCPKPPAPPAWLMQAAPDLLTPLNGIISVSEPGLKLPASK